MPPQQAPIMITEPHTTCAIVVMRLVQAGGQSVLG